MAGSFLIPWLFMVTQGGNPEHENCVRSNNICFFFFFFFALINRSSAIGLHSIFWMKSNIYKPVWALGKQRLFMWASEFAQDPDPMLAKGVVQPIFEKKSNFFPKKKTDN
jgi:hypothetical protein